MKLTSRNLSALGSLAIAVTVALVLAAMVLASPLLLDRAQAQSVAEQAVEDTSKEGESAAKPKPKKAPPPGPADDFDRGVPRTTVLGYFKAARDGDFERAAHYLDLRRFPESVRQSQGLVLARQLKIVLDRVGLWIDLDLVSNDPGGHVDDGLPPHQDSLGRIKTPEKTLDILLQRVRRQDGVKIWKFSTSTVAEIPNLYSEFGYRPFEESLLQIFPDVTFLGWQSWQWALYLALLALAFVAVLVPTWLIGWLLRRKDTDMSRQIARFVTRPLLITLWLVLDRVVGKYLGESATIHFVGRVDPLLPIVFTWFAVRLADLLIFWFGERLRQRGQEEATALLRPIRTFVRIVIISTATLVWLDNVGVRVSTLLAGLGVGGLAVALAAQDTLKNFLGSIMILLDKPYQVGQRIVVKGHDGVVEEIGLRSTKMRLLTGHLTTIPNDEMARVDIENIGRRPHIRRLTNITITFDTPLVKIEKAVKIIEDILDNHEGMDPEFPPRVYFNEFNSDSLNILMLYWYHPPAYWDFLAFNQRVNTRIMREFEKEGIEFAFPTTTAYLAHDDHRPLQLSLASNSELTTEG